MPHHPISSWGAAVWGTDRDQLVEVSSPKIVFPLVAAHESCRHVCSAHEASQTVCAHDVLGCRDGEAAHGLLRCVDTVFYRSKDWPSTVDRVDRLSIPLLVIDNA